MDMGGGRKGLRPEWIRQAVDDSLRRLQTDPVDRAAHEADLQALCEREGVGVGVISFFGLERGCLTGKYRSDAGLAEPSAASA
ncbi:MAG: hypothetical protein RJA10_665 [Pseudomonadota bacterium]|jgi:aryl-alcohol dehydrogenase-like predicted oxidoreductase